MMFQQNICVYSFQAPRQSASNDNHSIWFCAEIGEMFILNPCLSVAINWTFLHAIHIVLSMKQNQINEMAD